MRRQFLDFYDALTRRFSSHVLAQKGYVSYYAAFCARSAREQPPEEILTAGKPEMRKDPRILDLSSPFISGIASIGWSIRKDCARVKLPQAVSAGDFLSEGIARFSLFLSLFFSLFVCLINKWMRLYVCLSILLIIRSNRYSSDDIDLDMSDSLQEWYYHLSFLDC